MIDAKPYMDMCEHQHREIVALRAENALLHRAYSLAISKREYMAIGAMQGLLAACGDRLAGDSGPEIVRASVEIADALLAELKRTAAAPEGSA
jgi:hypothetical protein